MCQGRPSHYLWLYLVLLASAIQGVTPDAQDLASSNTVFLLFPGVADTGIPAERDNLPDEVSGPAQPELNMVVRGRSDADGSTGLLSFSTGYHDSVAIRDHIDRIGARDTKDRQPAGLIYSLCRLQC